MNKRHVGGRYEMLAADHLRQNGFRVLEMNYRNRFGEIDIIGRDGNYLVFCEVKYRKTASMGHPEEAVDYKKAGTICKVADYYRLVKNIPPNACIRFDVVAIEGDKLKWYKNAFTYHR